MYWCSEAESAALPATSDASLGGLRGLLLTVEHEDAMRPLSGAYTLRRRREAEGVAHSFVRVGQPRP